MFRRPTASWKRDLRADPRVARLLLRKLVGPLELHDDSRRPDWVEWVPFEAPVMPGALLDGLVHLVASPTGLSKLDRIKGRLRAA